MPGHFPAAATALNALLMATTVSGGGRTVEAIPIDRLREILARHPR